MADNPNKKKADSKRISRQPHEEAYQKRKARKTGNQTGSKRSNGKGA